MEVFWRHSGAGKEWTDPDPRALGPTPRPEPPEGGIEGVG